MKLWSERISSLSCCRQLFVQEDAVPPVPYPKQPRPGPMSNKKSSASSPLSGIPPAVCHDKLPLLGARHIQRCVETDRALHRCNLRTLCSVSCCCVKGIISVIRAFMCWWRLGSQCASLTGAQTPRASRISVHADWQQGSYIRWRFKPPSLFLSPSSELQSSFFTLSLLPLLSLSPKPPIYLSVFLPFFLHPVNFSFHNLNHNSQLQSFIWQNPQWCIAW